MYKNSNVFVDMSRICQKCKLLYNREFSISACSYIVRRSRSHKIYVSPCIRSADLEINVPRSHGREENIWKEPLSYRHKWVHPKDPTRRKPNFKQIDAVYERRFFRSPDQITKSIMNKDWEKSVKSQYEALYASYASPLPRNMVWKRPKPHEARQTLRPGNQRKLLPHAIAARRKANTMGSGIGYKRKPVVTYDPEQSYLYKKFRILHYGDDSK